MTKDLLKRKEIKKKDKVKKSNHKDVQLTYEDEATNFDNNENGNESFLVLVYRFLKSFKLTYNSNITNLTVPGVFISSKSIISYFVDGFSRSFDILLNTGSINDSFNRFININKYFGSALFHIPVTSKPLNPILGETSISSFHIDMGNGEIETENHCCFEVISHHPPRLVGVLYNKKLNVKINLDFTLNFYFMGTYVKIDLIGFIFIKANNELYYATLPSLNARFIRGFSEFGGQISILKLKSPNCIDSYDYKSVGKFIEKPLIGGDSDKYESYISNTINGNTHSLFGQWTKDIHLLDLKSKESKLIYTRPQNSSVIKRIDDTSLCTDTSNVWKGVFEADSQNNNKLKSLEKRKVEYHQRQLVIQRKKNNIEWIPKLFMKNQDNIWDLIN